METYKVERRGKKKKKKRKAPPPSKFANAYYDTTSPAAFTGSARRLAKEVEGATERQAREWLPRSRHVHAAQAGQTAVLPRVHLPGGSVLPMVGRFARRPSTRP